MKSNQPSELVGPPLSWRETRNEKWRSDTLGEKKTVGKLAAGSNERSPVASEPVVGRAGGE